MKLGIITYQKVNNYGADLQAYALQAKLRSLGYEVENIDYLHYKHPRFRPTKRSRRIIPVSLKNQIKAKLFPYVSKLRNIKHLSLIKKRKALFDAFENDFIRCSEEFNTIDRLYEAPPIYDVYIAGSDQIWHPRSDTSMAPYFLDFAPENAKCISYASSFGVSELPSAAFYRFKKFLKRFSAVGVREKSGLRIVNSMNLQVETKQVLDPTLLLTSEEWKLVARRPVKFPYSNFVLLYDLIPSPEAVALARQWAKELNCEMIRINDGIYGPSEFVWLFANASAVVTTSFHGTVFSILNNRPFYSVIPSQMTNAGRIESLVSMLNLEARMVRASDCINLTMVSTIDYTDANKHLENLRNDSINFLLRAIEEPSKKYIAQEPISTYAVWNNDNSIRSASTSGGLFRIFAEYVIKQKGVVFGAVFTEDFKKVCHISASTIDDLTPLMKSKYVWSDPAQAYKDAISALSNGKKVLFTGTPCQVAVISKLAEKYSGNLITLDFVCHGTPKPEVWTAYVNELEKNNNSVLINYEFRNKEKGWNFQNIVYEFKNGKRKRIIPWNDPFFHGFSINAFLRPACYECPFANPKRVSDFTIADCWRVASSHPQYDDNKGTSLVLVNTKKAQAIWQEIYSTGQIYGGEYDFDLAQMRNSALMNPAFKTNYVDLFDRIFKESSSFVTAAKSYLSWRKTLKYTIAYFVKKVGWFYFRRHQ